MEVKETKGREAHSYSPKICIMYSGASRGRCILNIPNVDGQNLVLAGCIL